jgi:hypothetical protein
MIEVWLNAARVERRRREEGKKGKKNYLTTRRFGHGESNPGLRVTSAILKGNGVPYGASEYLDRPVLC